MNKHYFVMKLKGHNVFLEDFSDEQDVIRAFDLNENELNGAYVLLAWYGGGGYDGSAFVLFERDGKLYEVNGGHCSCYGLEGQWDPEETSAEALIHRIKEGGLGNGGYYSGDNFGSELLKILE